MKRKGVDWVLHNPVADRIDLAGFDAVLSWPYGVKQTPGFLQACVQLERRARESDLPVINGLQGCDFRHTWCLRLWSRQGIPCPKYERIDDPARLQLPYPLIFRTDALHRGLNMFLVRNPDEAAQIARRDLTPRLDLALEFVETKSADGYYRKWRSHVIGDKVIPRQVQLSTNWKVNLFAGNASEAAIAEDQQFIAEGEPHAGLVALAARALKADIIALDYSKRDDGSYIFWEGNRNFDLSAGGHMWSQFRVSTGRSEEECAESLRIVGDAMADLILERAARR